MKSIFKVFVFVTGLLCVIFLVQNAMAPSTNIYSSVGIKFLRWSVNLPIFVMIVAGIFLGSVVGFMYEYRKSSSSSKKNKTLEVENKRLKVELSKLRNIPIEE